MRFDGHVPDDVVMDSMKELRDEIEFLKEWYKNSQRSLDLINETPNRVLTREEASNILLDFIAVGVVAGNMAMRNEGMLRAAQDGVTEAVAPSIVSDIEKMLKHASE